MLLAIGPRRSRAVKIRLLALLALWCAALAAQPHAYYQETVTTAGIAVTPNTQWVAADFGSSQIANAWTWSLAVGGTAPDTCAAKIQVCNASTVGACTGEEILDATSIEMTDCTTSQAVICADGLCAFRWVRVYFTAFTGTGASATTTLLGWAQ